jgi:hypothetical protein
VILRKADLEKAVKEYEKRTPCIEARNSPFSQEVMRWPRKNSERIIIIKSLMYAE